MRILGEVQAKDIKEKLGIGQTDLDRIDSNPLTYSEFEEIVMRADEQRDADQLRVCRLYLQIYTARNRGDSAGELPEGFDDETISLSWNMLRKGETNIKIENGVYKTQQKLFMHHLKKLALTLKDKTDAGEFTRAKDADKYFAEFRAVVVKDLKLMLPRQLWAPYHEVKEDFNAYFREHKRETLPDAI